MNRAFHLITVFWFLSGIISPVLAGECNLHPFTGISNNISDSFKGRNLVLHSAGILSTYAIANSGIDYEVYKYFSKKDDKTSIFAKTPRVGFYMPMLVGGGLYAYGNIADSKRETAAGSAVLQASLLGLSYSTLLKSITGRPHPAPEDYPDMKKASRTFRFGFLRGGAFWGWPSGHLTVNTAAATSLAYFYKDNPMLQIICYSYVGYVFYGVNSHHRGSMHWFSDTIAGGLFGYAIGSTVGKNMRKRWDKAGKGENTGYNHAPPNFVSYPGLYISKSF